MKRLGKLVLAVVALWLFLAVLMPLLYVAFSPNYYRDGMLVKVTYIGRFTGGVLSTVTYDEGYSNVMVFEHKLLFSHSTVFAKRNNDGTYTISSFSFDNKWCDEDYLKEHPKLLKEAEDLLELGRKRFAEAQN